MDIAASFDPANAPGNSYKRIYYGKRDGTERVSAADASWPRTAGTKFGPAKEDEWTISSLEIVDLNGDGNLDLVYGNLPS